MQNSDVWANDFHRYYEFLAKPFAVAPGVVVSPGGYDFKEYTTAYTLGFQHKVSGAINFGRGSFYDGDRTTVGYTGRLDLGSRLGVEPRVVGTVAGRDESRESRISRTNARRELEPVDVR